MNTNTEANRSKTDSIENSFENLEKQIHHRFFQLVTGQESFTPGKENPVQLYKDLVFYRFKEVIFNAYPICREQIGDESLISFLRDYVASGPKRTYIWQMPDEFRSFLLNEKNLTEQYPYLNDLLWLEWMDIGLLMRKYGPASLQKEINWSDKIALSASAELRMLTYAVYRRDFDTKGEFPLLLFYNYDEQEIQFQELTPFLYDFLLKLKGEGSEKSAEKNLEEICAKHSIDVKDAKELLLESLRNFQKQQIIHLSQS